MIIACDAIRFTPRQSGSPGFWGGMAGPIQVGLPYFSWLLLVGCFAVVCIAPKGAGTAAAVAAMRASQAGTSTLPGVAAAAAITTAALAASWALKKRAAVAVPAHFLAAPAAARNSKTAKDGRSSRGMPLSEVMQPPAEADVASDEDASYRPNRYRVRTQFDVVVMMLRCLQCVGGHRCVTCTLNREISIS